ncbi:MAG: thiamine diphosphokinase [Clostridia bacterium]|nr:thiamine diphosphokinase [Clostridia bacterium]
MKALIFSGGEFDNLPEYINVNEYGLIIAADSGYLSAQECGISPDIFIGDFDSVPESEVQSPEVIRLFPVKDMTDTQEAIDVAISRGAEHITILGALGGRIDHTLANLHLLKYARIKGVAAEIADIDSYICLAEKNTTILRRDGFCLSLIPLTDCNGVSVSGVYYPLNCAEMPVGNPYGISNEFTEDNAQISVETGELLIMLCRS